MSITQTLVCPFSKDVCDEINRLIQDCTDMQCVLQKLQQMGLDVSAMGGENDNMLQFARDFKATFFPNAI